MKQLKCATSKVIINEDVERKFRHRLRSNAQYEEGTYYLLSGRSQHNNGPIVLRNKKNQAPVIPKTN